MRVEISGELTTYIQERVRVDGFVTAQAYIHDLIEGDRRARESRQQLRHFVETGLASGAAAPDREADDQELLAIARGDIQ
jgi:hypothetical protein